jgi:hypothetical protein
MTSRRSSPQKAERAPTLVVQRSASVQPETTPHSPEGQSAMRAEAPMRIDCPLDSQRTPAASEPGRAPAGGPIDSDISNARQHTTQARMDHVKNELAQYASGSYLKQCELIAEWIHLALEEVRISGQLVHKNQGRRGRPPDEVKARAALELKIPGRSKEAKRKFIERALRVAAIQPGAKVAIRAAGVENHRGLLREIAKTEPDKQLARVEAKRKELDEATRNRVRPAAADVKSRAVIGVAEQTESARIEEIVGAGELGTRFNAELEQKQSELRRREGQISEKERELEEKERALKEKERALKEKESTARASTRANNTFFQHAICHA